MVRWRSAQKEAQVVNAGPRLHLLNRDLQYNLIAWPHAELSTLARSSQLRSTQYPRTPRPSLSSIKHPPKKSQSQLLERNISLQINNMNFSTP
jgi:hypothetical protein